MWNHQSLRGLRKKTPTVNTSSHSLNLTKNINSFFIQRQRCRPNFLRSLTALSRKTEARAINNILKNWRIRSGISIETVPNVPDLFLHFKHNISEEKACNDHLISVCLLRVKNVHALHAVPYPYLIIIDVNDFIFVIIIVRRHCQWLHGFVVMMIISTISTLYLRHRQELTLKLRHHLEDCHQTWETQGSCYNHFIKIYLQILDIISHLSY